jgi:hypothetical protein
MPPLSVGRMRQRLVRREAKSKIALVDKLVPPAFKTKANPNSAGRRAVGEQGRSQVGLHISMYMSD